MSKLFCQTSVQFLLIAIYLTRCGTLSQLKVLTERETLNDTETQSRVALDLNGCGGAIHNVGQFYKSWNDCGVYYDCVLDDSTFSYTQNTYNCPGDQSFDETFGYCVNTPACSTFPPYPRNQEQLPCTRDWDMHVHPENCGNFYICHWTGEYYTVELRTCGATVGDIQKPSYFDELLKHCVPYHDYGCPNNLVQNVEGVTCEDGSNSDRHPNPEDCHEFYQCRRVKGDLKVKLEHCPNGHHFEDASKECIEGECESEEVKLPEEWTCEKVGEFHQNPGDCREYFECQECKIPENGEWCYMHMEQCPEGYTFNETKQVCVEGRCPQWPPLLPDGWECKWDHEPNVHPSDCGKIYECLEDCPDGDWCYTVIDCPEGQTFDNDLKLCVDGDCPSDRPELPDGEGWKCSEDKELHVLPSDCSHYYSCHSCSKGKGWCYQDHDCGPGFFFNERSQACVKQERCPQWAPKLPKDWTCNVTSELHVHPQDCQKYYKCLVCPDGGWCHNLFECEAESHFNGDTKECESGPECWEPATTTPEPTEAPTDVPTTESTTTTTRRTTTTKPPPKIKPCWNYPDKGAIYEDEENCNCFYECVYVESWPFFFFKLFHNCCPDGYYYKEKLCQRGHC